MRVVNNKKTGAEQQAVEPRKQLKKPLSQAHLRWRSDEAKLRDEHLKKII